MEGFDPVFRRVLGSPNHQFWDPMILREERIWGFPKMNGFPQQPWENPTKNDHFGVFRGVPAFKEIPII